MRLFPAFAAALAALLPASAAASICHAFVEGAPGVRVASLGPVAAVEEEVTISYVGHSTYRIETAAGVTILTDYYGNDGEGPAPDVVTMNQAHESHFTDYPSPAIRHILRGWDPFEDGPAEHLVEERDVVIRNVTTDIRGWGERGRGGNSIFVFEVADICIGHLGHLHHRLDEAHYAQLGQLDVVMAPVDGTFTLDLPGMIEVLKRLKARVVLPMHAFGGVSLRRFLDGMSDEFVVRPIGGPSITVSVGSLPDKPTVMVPSNIAWGFFD
ncbi:MBL fold metallo-hydrolase [Limibaculum sp. M0105]|uniref:MBL fold metallo-hydrolase n=1 Tax=Thermohalobaculum xanthum TaxID=2753746 RepID=A0A8J7SIP0_9RHOB|nr:MBL fold metallo-hydrolase [Thermohalobaculum xanthum]MBK0400460.1 MBL fold metallo-hydrolase [Thermohalobaculum xanthum]